MSTTKYALNKNKYLLPEEVLKLEKLLVLQIDRNPRDCLLLLMALRTGGRAQEILNLRKMDLNKYDESVLIRGLKGSNDREIPLASTLFRRLVRYVDTLELKAEHELIFSISYNRLRQIWDLYRPAQKKFHCLRHTFAIQIYKKTRDIRLVQVALGHRNVMNTMIYADYIYSQEELRKLLL